MEHVLSSLLRVLAQTELLSTQTAVQTPMHYGMVSPLQMTVAELDKKTVIYLPRLTLVTPTTQQYRQVAGQLMQTARLAEQRIRIVTSANLK